MYKGKKMTKTNLKTIETKAQAYYTKKLFGKNTAPKAPISNEMVKQLLNPGLAQMKKLFKDME